jgi:hypothetical protein
MEQIYLTRRNLLTLLAKLDRAKAGERTYRSIVKQDITHNEYPCSVVAAITAVEDEDYYKDRVAGPVVDADEWAIRERGVS